MNLCCIVPAKIVTCSPISEHGFASNCDHMLSYISLRIGIWMMAIAAFTGNILVIFINHSGKDHSISKSTRLVFSNLAVADFLMSIYLFIIAFSDISYHDKYAIYVMQWFNSIPCAIATTLVFTSSFMSAFMMLLISVDRYLITSNPFSSSDTRQKWIIIAIISGWLLAFTIVIIPILLKRNSLGIFYYLSGTSNCVLTSYTSSRFGPMPLFLLLLIVFIFWILTAIFYIMLLKSVYKSTHSIRSNVPSRNCAIAMRVSLIFITNLISWLPLYATILLSILYFRGIDIIMLQFTFMVAFPLNSAINPYIYTATGTICFKRLLNFINGTLFSFISNSRNTAIINRTNITKDQVPKTTVAQFSVDKKLASRNINDMAFITVYNTYNEEY